MGLQALFTCDVCGKEEILPNYNVADAWYAIPIKTNNKKFYYREFQPFESEWLCSENCMETWVKLDPNKRAILVSDYDDHEKIPVYLIRRTKNYVWTNWYNAMFQLKNGFWNGKGGYHSRCEGHLREEDRIRLLNNR